MLIAIEGHRYSAHDPEFATLFPRLGIQEQDGFFCPNRVGYYFAKGVRDGEEGDAVYFLPKVILKEPDSSHPEEDHVLLGNLTPEDLLQKGRSAVAGIQEKLFLQQFSIWIYRAIRHFSETHPGSGILYKKAFSLLDPRGRKSDGTQLDVVLSLLDFYHRNRGWFILTMKQARSNSGKINWRKTIAKSKGLFSDESVIYPRPFTKKKTIDVDDELFSIFFSIVAYVNDTFGFREEVPEEFEIKRGKRFEIWIHEGLAKRKLVQIRGRYFSDRAKKLWQLCYAFCALAESFNAVRRGSDYLYVTGFHTVFEAMIDELVGDQDVPVKLIDQEDGRLVDHMYRDRSLFASDSDIWYIGDSKYYKIGHEVEGTSLQKQFSYARNVIQYNIGLVLREDGEKNPPLPLPYRDDLTEGYNVTPNFFISSTISDFDYKDDGFARRENVVRWRRHFANRLFDRDTLWVSHYDLNFLYVLSLYAAGNELKKDEFRHKARTLFRKEIRKLLNGAYDFYKLVPKADMTIKEALDPLFHSLLGKVFRIPGKQEWLLLALERVPILGGNPPFPPVYRSPEAIEKAWDDRVRLSGALLQRFDCQKLDQDFKPVGNPCLNDLQ